MQIVKQLRLNILNFIFAQVQHVQLLEVGEHKILDEGNGIPIETKHFEINEVGEERKWKEIELIAGEYQIRHGEYAILYRNRRKSRRRELKICQVVNLIRRQIEEIQFVKVTKEIPVELLNGIGADVEAFDIREVLEWLEVIRRPAVVHDVLEAPPKRFVVFYRQTVERLQRPEIPQEISITIFNKQILQALKVVEKTRLARVVEEDFITFNFKIL